MLRGLEFYALRQKLTVHPVRRIFNGMYHMLTVTMGRIGFAEVPDVVAPEERFKLDKIRGTSRLSLSHPPLCDSDRTGPVWYLDGRVQMLRRTFWR